MTDTNEKFTKDTFKFHKDKFQQHLKSINEIEDYTTIYSDFLLEFHPYFSEMNQLGKATLYKRTPKNLKGKFENRLINEDVFFSTQLEENWLNACFYKIKDENNNNIVLHYDGNIKKPTLNQIYISIFDNDRLTKMFFYHSDKNYMEDIYTYDQQGRIEQIIREGYWGNPKNILPTRTFKFDYDNNGEPTIFSKQLKANGQNEFEQVFPKVKR
jgi:hypothetical protein